MNDAKGKPVTGQMDMFKVPVLVPELGDKVERIGRKAVSYYDAREPLTKATGFIDGTITRRIRIAVAHSSARIASLLVVSGEGCWNMSVV